MMSPLSPPALDISKRLKFWPFYGCEMSSGYFNSLNIVRLSISSYASWLSGFLPLRNFCLCLLPIILYACFVFFLLIWRSSLHRLLTNLFFFLSYVTSGSFTMPQQLIKSWRFTSSALFRSSEFNLKRAWNVMLRSLLVWARSAHVSVCDSTKDRT